MDVVESITRNGKIYFSYIDDKGLLQPKVIDSYKPYALIEGAGDTDIQELVKGASVEKLHLDSIEVYNDFVKETSLDVYHKHVTPNYQFTDDFIKKTKPKDSGKPLYWYLDIETETIKGKSGTELAMEGSSSVIMIQIANNHDDSVIILHSYDWEPEEGDERWVGVNFMRAGDEEEMLDTFLELKDRLKPTLTTAHFGNIFDFPFLMNRYGVIKGIKKPGRKFSPFNSTSSRKVSLFYEDIKIDFPVGFPMLDFLDVYQLVTFGSRESWSLDFLVKYELGEAEGKVPYEERGFLSIHEFVRGEYNPYLDEDDNSPLKLAHGRGASSKEMNKLWLDLFFEYGIEDARILKKMDKKLSALDIIVSQANLFGVNYDDVFGTVKPWMMLLANRALHDRSKALPLTSHHEDYVIAGGHVFANQGLHNDVVIFDYTSLYPFCIMDLCLSPETYVEYEDLPPLLQKVQDSLIKYREIEKYLDNRNRIVVKDGRPETSHGMTPDEYHNLKEHRDACEEHMVKILSKLGPQIKELLIELNMTMAPNGTFYRKDPNALIPSLVSEIFGARRGEKDKIEEIYNNNKTIDDMLSELLSNLDVSQQNYKTAINSLYGFLTSAYSSLANANLGSAITSYGRFNIKEMTNHIVEYVGEDDCYKTLQDTDSFHLALKKVPGELGEEGRTKWIYDYASKNIVPEIESHSKEISSWFNGREMLEMDFEAIATHEIVVAKKRYVCKLWYDDRFLSSPKKKIVGIEIKRSSTPEVVKKAMDKVIDLIFEGKPKIVLNFIDKFKDALPYMDIRKTAIPTSISNLGKYYKGTSDNLDEDFILKGSTQAAKASHLHNVLISNYEGFESFDPISSGDKIKLVPLKYQICKEGASIEVFAFKDSRMLIEAGVRGKLTYDKDSAIKDKINYNVLYDKTFHTPIKNLLDSIGWESDKRKSKLKGVL